MSLDLMKASENQGERFSNLVQRHCVNTKIVLVDVRIYN